MTSVTKARLPRGASALAVTLGFDPFAYLTRVERGLYDAVLVNAANKGQVLVCERRSRANAIAQVVEYLAQHNAKG